MTEKNGKYYCDICKDTEPIVKGTGFRFDNNRLGIEHSHQTCYLSKQTETKELLISKEAKQFLNKEGIELTPQEATSIADDNIRFAKDMIKEYKEKNDRQ